MVVQLCGEPVQGMNPPGKKKLFLQKKSSSWQDRLTLLVSSPCNHTSEMEGVKETAFLLWLNCCGTVYKYTHMYIYVNGKRSSNFATNKARTIALIVD